MDETRQRRSRPWRNLLVWSVLIFGILQLAIRLPSAATRPSAGFASYYTVSRLTLERRPWSKAWDDVWIGAEIQRHTPTVRDIFRPNPPTAALLALPVAWMPYRWARIAWTVGSLLTLGALWRWTVVRCSLQGLAVPMSAGCFLLFDPFHACLWNGQVYIFLSALLAIAIEAVTRIPFAASRSAHGRFLYRSAGSALGLLIALKSAAVPVALVCLRKDSRRLLPWVLATMALATLLSILVSGIEPWRAYGVHLAQPSAVFDRPEQVVTAYQTVPSIAGHLTTIHSGWNPSPLIDAPSFGHAIYWIGAVLLLGAGVGLLVFSGQVALTMAALGLIHLLLSPWSLDYHYALALPPFVVAASAMRAKIRYRRDAILLALAVLLLSVPARWYNAPALQPGAAALLAYPKVYGALLLLGLVVIYAVPRTKAIR